MAKTEIELTRDEIYHLRIFERLAEPLTCSQVVALEKSASCIETSEGLVFPMVCYLLAGEGLLDKTIDPIRLTTVLRLSITGYELLIKRFGPKFDVTSSHLKDGVLNVSTLPHGLNAWQTEILKLAAPRHGRAPEHGRICVPKTYPTSSEGAGLVVNKRLATIENVTTFKTGEEIEYRLGSNTVPEGITEFLESFEPNIYACWRLEDMNLVRPGSEFYKQIVPRFFILDAGNFIPLSHDDSLTLKYALDEGWITHDNPYFRYGKKFTDQNVTLCGWELRLTEKARAMLVETSHIEEAELDLSQELEQPNLKAHVTPTIPDQDEPQGDSSPDPELYYHEKQERQLQKTLTFAAAYGMDPKDLEAMSKRLGNTKMGNVSAASIEVEGRQDLPGSLFTTTELKGVLQTEVQMDKDQVAKFKETWFKQYGGKAKDEGPKD